MLRGHSFIGERNVMKKASLLVLLVLLAGGAYAHERTSSCVVGVTGAEASVTVKGFRSSAACADMIASKKRDYYRRDTPPDGGVLCEIQNGQRRYIVRDHGAFMFVGRSLCAAIADDSKADR
jgi:hypothetical protein